MIATKALTRCEAAVLVLIDRRGPQQVVNDPQLTVFIDQCWDKVNHPFHLNGSMSRTAMRVIKRKRVLDMHGVLPEGHHPPLVVVGLTIVPRKSGEYLQVMENMVGLILTMEKRRKG